MQFPEPIYHASYQNKLEHYLAVSKQSLYVYKGMLIDSLLIGEDITGTFRLH